MRHVVSLSGGVSSAVAADRVIGKYGKDVVTLWIADTRWEDEDLWRFVDDCCQRWDINLLHVAEGRTPLQVAEDQNLIPNQKIAPCSFRLKVDPFVAWLKDEPKPLTVHLGMDWSEVHRHSAPRQRYEAFDGVCVDFPLMWKPYCYDVFAEVRSWGIKIPRLYGMGFPHNNCGGRCVKQGILEWRRLKIHFPERFAEVRDWESMMRAKGEPWSNYAIARDQSGGNVKPLTLSEIETMNEPEPGHAFQEDLFSCFCTY